MKIAVLIVAAGRGVRSGGEIPKQYRDIDGQTVLEKSLSCFTGLSDLTNVVVAIHKDDLKLFEQSVKNVEMEVMGIGGGASRTESVRAGLKLLASLNPDIVLIHDAARPFLPRSVIDDVVDCLREYQAAVPVLPIADAVKTLAGDAVDRENLVRVQTPQGFVFKDILDAYTNIPAGEKYADDIEVARNAGMRIGMCTGSELNIKLTYPEDFKALERHNQMISVSGSGYDVHRTCEGKSLWLCGVEIQAGFSLQGHSDADVGLHALTDALLGAIGAGDIGDHFPPSDDKWKNANSRKFLEFARTSVQEVGGILDHVDLTLICEAPKIKPHRQKMRETIADILDIPVSSVSVKATTTEGLGFVGRGEGIAAHATASIRRPNA